MTFQHFMGPSWPWSNGSFDLIYNYLCNPCLSPLMLWVRISIRVRCTTLCDQVCQWHVGGFLRVLRFPPPVILTHKQTTNIFFICRMIKTFGGDTLVELVDDDKTINCHIQDKLDRDEEVNIAFCSPSKFGYEWPVKNECDNHKARDLINGLIFYKV